MPIIGNFPSGSGGSGGGGLALAAVTDIKALTAAGKVYIKWTDPDDLVVAGSTLASWGGTLLVRKAGSAPVSRRDGTVVLDSKTRNAYQSSYFCDSGLTDGVEYFYKFFPYTTGGSYTDSAEDAFSVTPNPVTLGNVSGMSAEAAGNGKLAIKWTDPAATVVSDGVTLATWEKTVVVVKAGSYATDPDDADAAFRKVVTTRNQYATSALTATGLTNGTEYFVTFFPMSTDGAVNKANANRTTGTANRLTLTVPTQSGTLTYNGDAQAPTLSNYDANKMTLGGVTSKTDAGSYTATVTPKDDYMWTDGTITAKNVTWTIGKAAGSLSLSPTSLTFNMDKKSGTIAITRAGDGKITVTSSNTSVATVSLSGTTVTVSSVNDTNGEATITVSVAEGTNYKAPANKTCKVTASFVSTTLNDNSWATIKAVSDANQGSNYWKVGDTKRITINGKVGNFTFSNLSIDAFILGFNHNSAKEGDKRIHFAIGKINGTMVSLVDSQFGNEQTSAGYFHMNTSRTNSGGWKGSAMYKTLLGNSRTPTSPVANSLMAALPSDLRAVMKSVTKYTDNTGNSSNVAANVTASTDYLTLLAEFEVQGARTYANQYEQNSQLQYEYFKSGNSKVAYRHSATSTTAWWWLRSARYNSSYHFCRVNTGGNASDYSASWSAGVLPGFFV